MSLSRASYLALVENIQNILNRVLVETLQCFPPACFRVINNLPSLVQFACQSEADRDDLTADCKEVARVLSSQSSRGWKES
jgi:hypothetical protein